ncbi:MAG TPA: hypothetical protein VFH61_15135 [Thermoleophilia bacterium]|nr:hypothetical protein [Thermoleophilia bacterium]
MDVTVEIRVVVDRSDYGERKGIGIGFKCGDGTEHHTLLTQDQATILLHRLQKAIDEKDPT